MIYGYPNRPTVIAGQALRLHYSGDRPKFAVDLYRQGPNTAPDWVMRFPAQGWLDGKLSTFQRGDADQNWPFIDITIPSDATPGVYIANFTEADDANGTHATAPSTATPDARSAKALFVVKSAVPGRPILLKLALFTYHAYNETNGGSLYTSLDNKKSFLHRPGGGTGGDVFDDPTDPDYDPTDPNHNSPRQTFAHWEAPFVSWLETNGFKDSVDYCTDLDVEENNALLHSYQVLVCVGHDEYWTPGIRAAIKQFRDFGGNVAIFSGNTCFRPINYYADDFAIERFGVPDQIKMAWRLVDPPDPENSITGVSYSRAGGWWAAKRPPVGYTVKAAGHWVFDGLALQPDQVIGREDFLVGYECDGCLFSADGNGNLMATGEDQTPTDFHVLAIGLVPGWQRETPVTQDQDQVATMGLYVSQSGSTVFNAATTDWGRVLFKGSAESRTVLGTITRNVLTRLGRQTGLTSLATFDQIVTVDGFFSSDDRFRHAIVATTDRSITEVFFNPQQGQGQAVLQGPGALPGNVIDVGAFYSDDDMYRHVIAALNNGEIWEVFYSPLTGQGHTVLAQLSDVVAVSGFFSADDGFRHAIVATADGNVTEIFYNPQSGAGQVVLGNFSGVVDVASFFTADDNFRHVIVATADGNITEIFYNPQSGSGRAVLANTPGAIRVSAFYVPDDVVFGRRVVVVTKDGAILEIKYGPDGGIFTTELLSVGGAIDVGGFYSSDDRYRHAIVAASNGSVREIFYKP
jgi:hypothetical protein